MQTGISAEDLLKKELLELYRELNRIIPSSMNNNPHDLLKACKIINYVASKDLYLDVVGDRMAYIYDIDIVLTDIDIDRLPVLAYIIPEILYEIIYINLRKEGLRIRIEIDLPGKKVSSIKLYIKLYVLPGSYRSVAGVYGDQPKDIYVNYGMDFNMLTRLATLLGRERKKLVETVKRVLEAPIDTKAMAAIKKKVWNELRRMSMSPKDYTPLKRITLLYIYSLIPGIKRY